MGTLIAWVLVRDDFRGKSARQRADRPAVRAADDRRRPHAARALRPERPDRASTSPTRASAIVLALLFVTLPFVVRAVQPVLIGARPRGRGGRRVARRQPADDLPPDHPARAAAGDPGRRRPRLRARGRRVRLGRADQRQPPLQDRGRRRCSCSGSIESDNATGAAAVSVVLLAISFLCCWASRTSLAEGSSDEPRSDCAPSRIGYLAALLVVPVGMVFYRAFEHGFAAAWDAVTTPPAQHAFYLTCVITLVAVPLQRRSSAWSPPGCSPATTSAASGCSTC